MHTPSTLAPMPNAHPLQASPSSPEARTPDWGPVVQASALLGARQSVDIEYKGQRYRLQTTKAGKLILTK
ncbi:hemin uptake protein HemP [Rhodoferax bucti]|uniref:hemin uptake protein HemP n=1 Tax=Rhodoferax bucti TaxID=2576305 RepID=UPI001107C108|nr:hemin uptake protein HemP [Rhodoferax bucti]